MKYDDEMLATDESFIKQAQEFSQKLNMQENNISEEEVKSKVKRLLYLLTINQEYLSSINNFMQKNRRYKVTAQELKLDNAISIIENHKNQLLSLNLVSLETSPLNLSKNIKVAIYECCNNNAEILNILLWLLIFKNIFNTPHTISNMAYEQTQILQSVLGLF